MKKCALRKRAMERLKVDVIEAGFPAASPGDFEAVQAVAVPLKTAPSAVWPEHWIKI
jgi:isopropylmalate/homocitrate/citramalate synthase